MQLTLPGFSSTSAKNTFAAPAAYRGLYAFHKYWGKKPAEPISYLIQKLCPENGLVVDPFLGSGVAALEAVRLKRKFIGIDINPVAVRIARLLILPPSARSLHEALSHVEMLAKEKILKSYVTSQRTPATHYVWRNEVMEKVWLTNGNSRKRIELPPEEEDISLAEQFASYQPQRLRAPRFFTNSRINSSAALTFKDLFTGRALRNIELLLAAIDNLPAAMQEAMMLSLTAAVGQMSKMVFAITGRGKTSGSASDRMEVGSWVIGYWRPEQHFEINVWACFERRVQKLIKAVSALETTRYDITSGECSSVCADSADCALLNGDTLRYLPDLPDKSINLIITDPPHGDRIPYLELSEIWNVILDEKPLFESEIVISNAKERAKKIADYNQDMSRFLDIASQKLSDSGCLVLFFNARTKTGWNFLKNFSDNAAGMEYRGCFPLVYSAGSVVQDNRAKALRTDYGLVFSRSMTVLPLLTDIPGWMSNLPAPKE
ncbi:Methyltransferase [Candidatus Electronema halotolerans]